MFVCASGCPKMNRGRQGLFAAQADRRTPVDLQQTVRLAVPGWRVRPAAVITTNDLAAIGVLQAVQEAGVQVPDEMSLVGFDDLPIASMVYPALTTIHLSRRDIVHNTSTA